MNHIFDFTTKTFELVGALFVLAVVSSVLFGFNVIEPTLQWLNNSSNLLSMIVIFVIYMLFKGEIDNG